MSKKKLISTLKSLLYFLIALFSVGTVKEGCSDGPTRSVIFSGITVTDEFGNALSWDSGDWCLPGPTPPTSEVMVEPQPPPHLPTSFYMSPAYPNPAKDSVTILYALPTNNAVKLWIINRYGSNVITLVDGYETAGYKAVVWHLLDSSSRRVGSDIYRAIVEAGQFRCQGDIKVE